MVIRKLVIKRLTPSYQEEVSTIAPEALCGASSEYLTRLNVTRKEIECRYTLKASYQEENLLGKRHVLIFVYLMKVFIASTNSNCMLSKSLWFLGFGSISSKTVVSSIHLFGKNIETG
jgi:hypothetical protein